MYVLVKRSETNVKEIVQSSETIVKRWKRLGVNIGQRFGHGV